MLHRPSFFDASCQSCFVSSSHVGRLLGQSSSGSAQSAPDLGSPDVLLLDEPTNHLDLEAVGGPRRCAVRERPEGSVSDRSVWAAEANKPRLEAHHVEGEHGWSEDVPLYKQGDAFLF